ncbi:hypothetical protein [Gemmobacter aquatilis]|uniref:hypothetical protein n=1 Tax=Gemmobacter aquatilis TaxID=933059 RepID=UPI000B815F20|nr:hypothetical protein [Gemmobacter aquatilis]
MSQLLRQGFIAALAPQGVPNLDIVVSDIGGQRQFGIQVKSRLEKGADGGWHMGAKHEAIESDQLFYCFVDFGLSETGAAKTYIIPSRVVARVLRDSHSAWLARPGKNGHVRKDSNVRRLTPDYTYAYAPDSPVYATGWLDPYLEAWHLLQA